MSVALVFLLAAVVAYLWTMHRIRKQRDRELDAYWAWQHKRWQAIYDDPDFPRHLESSPEHRRILDMENH